jgi:hypothetical protein
MAYQNQVAHKGYLQQQKSLLRGRLPEFQCDDQLADRRQLDFGS